MMKRYTIFTYLSILLTSLTLFSCEDKIDFSNGVIGDGEALVEATLTFKADVANLGSRSSGTAISTIEDLHIVIYNADEDTTFYKLVNNVSFEDDVNNSSTPDDYEGTTTENATHKVKVNGLVLPYGKYYMYAVANLGKDLEEEEVATIDKLKSIECTWDFSPMQYEYDRDNENASPNGQKQINAQMFGYFTSIENPESRNTNGSAFAEQDPVVVINQPIVRLHSWIKRLASKVTIAYNGKGLHEGVYVYIHNVSIRQIPLYCYLGKDNNPTNPDSVTKAYFDKSVPEEFKSQVLYYNRDGSIGNYSEYLPTEENGLKWMPVAKGVASGTDHQGIVGAYNHTNTDPALFFYENMKGVHPKNPKPQQPDSVGSNVKENDWLGDYQDGIKYGTFIEVEAYYKCDIVPISQGPIRYRFMLGQNIDDDYNATRNCHYKLTLGFRGYANQPDWHIEYVRKVPEINAPEVYIPYTYNTSVKFPVTVTGNPTSIDVELIENNWGPYDLDNDKVPDGNPNTSVNKTDFDERTLQFEWWKEIYDNNYNNSGAYTKTLTINNSTTNNSRDNFLYGRHKSVQKLKDGQLSDDPNEYYSVTPIWAGFLRLVQPADYVNENVALPTDIVTGADYGYAGESQSYQTKEQLNDFRNYYINCPHSKDVDQLKNLGKRSFTIWDPNDLSTENSLDVPFDELNTGRNAYTVEKELDAENKVKGVSITMNLWTQPKTMCGISGFTGNNPYEDYGRKAVLRITAHYLDSDRKENKIMKDIPVYQTERLVNPKAVWRSHELQNDDDNEFHVILYKKDSDNPTKFEQVISQGAWSAKIIKNTKDGFISLNAKGNNEVSGSTLSPVDFKILFNNKNIGATECECAIIEVRYHGNNCVHNIFVRQGFHQPLQISKDGAYWSSYNLYSCGTPDDNDYPVSGDAVDATFTFNPIALGSFFKRLNYYQAINVNNVENTAAGFGPLDIPKTDSKFALTKRAEAFWKTWSEIDRYISPDKSWVSKFNVTQEITSGDETVTVKRPYRIAKVSDYNLLKQQEFGIGVIYCNGATEPSDKTSIAYGFLDEDNKTISLAAGMRGIICYNPDNAHQIFFPVGTMGIGRRNGQNIPGFPEPKGSLRYGALPSNYTIGNTSPNTLRPITYNISRASGAIYWADEENNGPHPCWDMNYSDLNFNQYDGLFGDALPIRLVIDDDKLNASN